MSGPKRKTPKRSLLNHIHPNTPKTMTRYRATPSKTHARSYNVVDMTRRNEWGERYVVQPALTRNQAVELADRMNDQVDHENA